MTTSKGILTTTAAARRLVTLLGRALTTQEHERLRAWFPRGVPESLLDDVAEKLRRPRPQLRIVK